MSLGRREGFVAELRSVFLVGSQLYFTLDSLLLLKVLGMFRGFPSRLLLRARLMFVAYFFRV